MNTHWSQKIPFRFFANILLIFLGTFLSVGCISTERVISDTWQYYSIDARNILAKLGSNEADYKALFFLESESMAISPRYEKTDVPWSEADFYLVVEAMHQHEWGEGLATWLPFTQLRSYDCQDLEVGPYAIDFTYYKNQGDSRFVSFIAPDPKVNLIRTRHTEYSPRVSEWDVMEIDKILSASEALKIAEQAGGEEVRGKLNNLCYILVDYNQASANTYPHPIWRVAYDNDDQHLTVVSYDLNAYTGEIDKITEFK